MAIALIPVLVLLYFSDNIYGYYRFKQYCENEGGLKIYKKANLNKGWLVEDYGDLLSILKFKEVAFVRYNDSKSYDFFYNEGSRDRISSYNKTPENKSRSISYVWRVYKEPVIGVDRLTSSNFEVRDALTGEIFSVYKKFVYSILDRKKTLLASPSYVDCFKRGEGNFSELKDIFDYNIKE